MNWIGDAKLKVGRGVPGACGARCLRMGALHFALGRCGAVEAAQLDALASSQLPALVLRINALLASANQGAVASFRESFSERLR